MTDKVEELEEQIRVLNEQYKEIQESVKILISIIVEQIEDGEEAGSDEGPQPYTPESSIGPSMVMFN